MIGAGHYDFPDQLFNVPVVLDKENRKIAQLEDKLANKNEVISALMEENVKSNKASGEL